MSTEDLIKRADDRLNNGNSARLQKSADPEEPPTEGFVAGMQGALYVIQTTQGRYYAQMISTGAAPTGGKVSLQVTSQGTATCKVMPA